MSDDPASPSLPEWLREHMKSDETAIARIDERLSAIEKALDKALTAHETRLTGYGSRIRALELWRAALTGGGVLLAGIVSYLLGK